MLITKWRLLGDDCRSPHIMHNSSITQCSNVSNEFNISQGMLCETIYAYGRNIISTEIWWILIWKKSGWGVVGKYVPRENRIIA